MQQKSENKLLGGVTQQKKTSSILKSMSGQRNEKPELEEISVLCNASLLVNWKQNHRHIRIQGLRKAKYDSIYVVGKKTQR